MKTKILALIAVSLTAGGMWGFERKLVPTGVALAIPLGYYGQIKDRSGLAAKHGLHVLAGVVDSTYRGETKVVLINLDGAKSFHAEAGKRIAQIIFLPYASAAFVPVTELEDSVRSAQGFGSRGR